MSAPERPGEGSKPARAERGRRNTARSAARLAVVQALYQMELTGRGVESVATEFALHRLKTPTDGLDLSGADAGFFKDLLFGVVAKQVTVDNLVEQALAVGWTLERLDSTLRALLRAAAYEIAERPDIPPRVVIDEYVEVTRAFFEAAEPAFVNGVLDSIARTVRPEAMGARPER